MIKKKYEGLQICFFSPFFNMQSPPSNETVEVANGYVIFLTYRKQGKRYYAFSKSELLIKLEELYNEVKITNDETKEEVKAIEQPTMDEIHQYLNDKGDDFSIHSWHHPIMEFKIMIAGPSNFALRWCDAHNGEKAFSSQTTTKSAHKQ